jgi:hypothetical protein
VASYLSNRALLDRAWRKPAVPIVTDDPPPVITFNIGGALHPSIGAEPEPTIEAAKPRLLTALDE